MMPSVLNSVKYCSLDKYQHISRQLQCQQETLVSPLECVSSLEECVSVSELSGNWYFLQ